MTHGHPKAEDGIGGKDHGTAALEHLYRMLQACFVGHDPSPRMILRPEQTLPCSSPAIIGAFHLREKTRTRSKAAITPEADRTCS